MKITFGLHLDGQRSWCRQNRLGHATVGPLGFLSLLETFLGLPKPAASEGERILQYRDLLSKLDNSSRFYHYSFEADQYTVARTLLGWRDKWHLYGWSGSFGVEAPHRLRDMAEIENSSPLILTPGIGERLKAIAIVLGQRKHPIESVELIDPIEDFPPAWRGVLHKIPVTQREALSTSAESTNLSHLQQALRNPSTNRIPWSDDDSSLTVFRSHSRISASALISGLASQAPGSTLVIAESEGAMYDTLSSAYGYATLGISERSELRPSLQLLSLAFDLIWKPLDVYALLEFLAHPMSPLPRYASSMLAAAVASQPGIGGEKWQLAIKKIQEVAGDKVDEVMETIHQWLKPPFIEAEESVPISVLEQAAERVAKAFRARLGDDDYFTQRAQHSGNMQCTQIASALKLLRKQGVTAISRLQLDQMIEQTGGSGEGSASCRPEVGSPLLATSPAAVIESSETVIWWNMAAPSLPAAYPWHIHELRSLRDAGVMLPDMSEVLETEARYWLRPILAAGKQLILCLPPEGDEVHPAWLSIERVFEKHAIKVIAVEDALENKLPAARVVAVPHKALPRKKRWWKIEGSEIPPLKRHSFSSLDKFINNPVEWVLRYPAKINPPNILTVSGGNMLLGSIAHRSVELLHTQPNVMEWSQDQVAAWVDKRLQQLLEEEGAVLLLPGKRASVEAFRQKLRAAVRLLHHHLQSAGVNQVIPEKHLSGSFFMGELQGYIDILATRPDGTATVLDMKWARGRAYREKLQDNRQLQLAIYGELMRQETGNWATPAYYILAEGNLFAQDDSFFPEATVARVKEEGGSPMLWQQALETLRWRHGQISGGLIELVIEGTEPDADSLWPEDALEIDEPSRWPSDYTSLMGWGVDA
jgi:hypothetical protein